MGVSEGDLSPTDELGILLKPAGGGIYLVSSGAEQQLALQRRIYGVQTTREIELAHSANLKTLAAASVGILGVPSDVGAGFLRGANLGPQEIRLELLRSNADWFANARSRGIVDLGDVFVVPQLLHDEMLSREQQEKSRRSIYAEVESPARDRLPVSPLSIEERALALALGLNPALRLLVLGGDHSTAWPVAKTLAARTPKLGIVQVDAHTDMLEQRLGVDYCFATWSFHASRQLASPARLLQLGVRASRFTKEHWEGTYGIRQLWAEECLRDPKGAIQRSCDHLASVGVEQIYFSNDIDGTDERFADATGTPEPKGLTPDFVHALIETLGKNFTVIAGDIMEVAPPIPRTPDGTKRTLTLARQYLEATLATMA